MGLILFYLKFFERREWADAFLDGMLYLNPLGYFLNLEADRDDGRADGYEAAARWTQPHPDLILEVAGIRIPPEDLSGPVVMQDTSFNAVNLMCLYAGFSGPFERLSLDDVAAFKEHLWIPEASLRMGNHALLVGNVTEFNQRVVAAVRKAGYGLKARRVVYFDPTTFSGEISDPLFYKQDSFAFQQEYRFAVFSGKTEPEPLLLDVGPLSDICSLVDVKGRVNGSRRDRPSGSPFSSCEVVARNVIGCRADPLSSYSAV